MTAQAAGTTTNLATNIGPSSARCVGCDWHRDGINRQGWLAIRAAAIRHVRSSGHTVVANVGHVLTYARIG